MASETSQLVLRIGEVILKIGSVWTENFLIWMYHALLQATLRFTRHVPPVDHS